MLIATDAITTLKEIALRFLPRTNVPDRDRWRTLSDDGIWKHVFGQVVVAGNESAQTRLAKSTDLQNALTFERIRDLSPADRRAIIHNALRTAGARYASADIAKCRKTKALAANFDFLTAFPGGPHAYFQFLAALPDDETRVSRVQSDMAYIKLKGSRDLLTGLGLVTNVVALDVRILNILRLLGAQIADDVQTNPARYRALQDELLTNVCLPIGMTGAAFDRVLFQNYDDIMHVLRDRNTQQIVGREPR